MGSPLFGSLSPEFTGFPCVIIERSCVEISAHFFLIENISLSPSRIDRKDWLLELSGTFSCKSLFCHFLFYFIFYDHNVLIFIHIINYMEG